MRYTYFDVLLLAANLAAFTTLSMARSPEIPQPDSEKACVSRGGQWAGLDRMSNVVCTVGKQKCSDSSQCKNSCVAPLSAQKGDEVTGICSNPNQVGGLFSTLVVSKGRAVQLDIVP
jgi:hypothetical protein